MPIQRPDKIPEKSKLREEGLHVAHSVRLQFIRMGKAWRQEHEVAVFRKEREMNDAAQLPFFLFNPGPQSIGQCCPH